MSMLSNCLTKNRPFDEYIADIASLPTPTEEQIANFCRYVMGDHSWYKTQIQQGEAYTFFLNSDIGPCSSGQFPLNRKELMQSPEYVRLFGFLDYRFGHGHVGNRHIVPDAVQERGTVVCYPYLSNQEDAYDLIWYRNKDVVDSIDTLIHPDVELLKQLLVKRAARQSVSAKANEVCDAGKFLAVQMVSHYEKETSPSNYIQQRMAEYRAQVSDVEFATLQPWSDRIDEAVAEERKVYDILNGREAAKIRTAIETVLAWLEAHRERQ